jgi:drug/metabolite transporter (DMT)-like permease
LFLGEPLTMRQLGGAVLVLSGVALTRIRPRKQVPVDM